MANLGYNLAREALVVLSSSAVSSRRMQNHTTAEIVAAAASGTHMQPPWDHHLIYPHMLVRHKAIS